MDTTDLDFTQAIVQDAIRSGVYTVLPAKVTNVSQFNSQQVINAVPLIGRRYEDGTYLEPQEIYNIPVMFPSAGGGILSFPIKKDDGVLLLFSMRDLDNWEDSNGVDTLPPYSSRNHAMTDAIAIAGLYTKNNNLHPNPTDVEIKFAGSSIKMKPNGDVVEDVFKDKILNIPNGSLKINTPSILHNDVEIGETHYHEQANDSDGNTQEDTEHVFR